MPASSANLSCVMPICFLKYLILSPIVTFIVPRISNKYIIPCLKNIYYGHLKILDNSEFAIHNKMQKASNRLYKDRYDIYMIENKMIYITANELAVMLGVYVGHAYK